MKNMKTKLVLILAAVMMFSVLLTGCQSKIPPADQTMTAMYNLVVKEDAAPMKDLLGFASEDDVRSSMLSKDYTGVAETFKNEFTGAGIDFSDEEIQQMSDTMKGLMNKLTCTAEIQGQAKDETTVVLKVTGYSNADMTKVMSDLITETQSNMDQETAKAIMSGDEEAAKKLMQDVIKQFITKIGEMEPSTETTDVTVKCKKMKVEVSGKEKIAWMPEDTNKLVSDLQSATMK